MISKMTTRKWFALGITLFTVIFIWYLIDHKIITLRQEEAAQNISTEQKEEPKKTLEEKIDAEKKKEAVANSPATTAETATASIDEDLKSWISNESKNLDLKDKSPKETEKRLQLFAGQLRQSQLDQLGATVLNNSAAANERILSTYLLTLNDTDIASENLKKISLEKLNVQGDIKPHSADEVRRAQELSMKYMAIDELAKRAKKNLPDYNRLVSIAHSAPVREVRDYAERKLKNIGP